MKLARALLVVAALYLVGLGTPHLLEPDEGRYADVTRELVHADSWVVPRLNGVPFLDKPPLVTWLGAISIELLGASPFALRLVPALFAIASAATSAWLASALCGPRAAPWAALAAGTAPLAFVGRIYILDAPLAALMALSFALVLRGAGLLARPPSHAFAALGGIALGLATLVKGPVAIGLVGLGNVGALVLVRDLPELRRRVVSPLPWVVAVLVAAPWYALVYRASPDFFRVFIWEENFKRFAGTAVEHRHWPTFLIVTTLWGLGPWGLVGLCGYFRGDHSSKKRNATEEVQRLGRSALLVHAAIVVGFFSFSSTRVETYVLPAFPALAALVGGEAVRALEAPRARRALGAIFLVVAALCVVASLGGVVLGLGLIPARGLLKAASEGTNPLLALLPLPIVALAVKSARGARPLEASLRLALALVAALPCASQSFRRASELKSAEPIAEAVLSRQGQIGNATVAIFHYYYRGLPYYLDAPVTLLGESGELRFEAFAARPELFMPDFPSPEPGETNEACTLAFLKSTRPLLLVVPIGDPRVHRLDRFLETCKRADVAPVKVGSYGDDELWEILR